MTYEMASNEDFTVVLSSGGQISFPQVDAGISATVATQEYVDNAASALSSQIDAESPLLARSFAIQQQVGWTYDRANEQTMYFRPRYFGMNDGDLFKGIIIRTKDTNLTPFPVVYMRLKRYPDGSVLGISEAVEYPNTANTDVVFRLTQAVALPSKDSYYIIDFATTPDGSAITRFGMRIYVVSSGTNPDCYFQESNFVPVMTVQFYSFAEVIAPSASTKIGQLADAYETKLELNAISSNISSNYYTKDKTDEAIERVAAYYITYNANGDAFPTASSLVDATTYYSGGQLRVPTRNDYAVVLSDEMHDNAEWRYIYAMPDGQATGQWEAQYPIETNDYEALSHKPSINDVTLSGNKTAYQLGLAAIADTTLTPIYSDTPTFSEWVCDPAEYVEDRNSVKWKDGAWQCYNGAVRVQEGTVTDFNATVVSCYLFTATRTRTDILGYRLGSQSDKPLASEAEAEALRTEVAGKLDKSGGNVTGLLKIETINSPNLELWNSEGGTSVFLDAELSYTKNNIHNVDTSFSWPNRDADDNNMMRHHDLTYLLAAYCAPVFDSTAQYAVGDFCRREIKGVQYGFRCVADHTGGWNYGHFARVLLPTEIEALDAAFASKLNSASAAPAWVSGTTYIANALVTYNGVVYCNTGGGTFMSDIPPSADTNWEAKPVSDLFLPLTGGKVGGILDVENTLRVGKDNEYGGYIDIASFSGETTEYNANAIVLPDHTELNFPNKPGVNYIALVTPSVSAAGHLAALDANGNPVDSGIGKDTVVTNTVLSGETMPSAPTQNELAEAVKKIFTALGGTVTP